MTSIALGVFIVFIVYVMVWSIKNDDAKSIGDQTGYIRMRDPSVAEPESAGRHAPRSEGGASRRPQRTSKRRQAHRGP